MRVVAGSINRSIPFHLETPAGADATGLTIADLDLQYWRIGANAPSAKVDATALAAITTAHTDNYGIEVDATDQPGLHRFDFPDAAFVIGVPGVILTVKGAAIRTSHMYIELVGGEKYEPVDPYKIDFDMEQVPPEFYNPDGTLAYTKTVASVPDAEAEDITGTALNP